MVLCSTVFTVVIPLYCLYFCLCIGFYSPLRCTVSGGAAHHRLSAPHSFNITSNSFTTCLNASVGRKIFINVKLWYHQHYQKSVNSTQTHQHHPSYIPWTLYSEPTVIRFQRCRPGLECTVLLLIGWWPFSALHQTQDPSSHLHATAQ